MSNSDSFSTSQPLAQIQNSKLSQSDDYQGLRNMNSRKQSSGSYRTIDPYISPKRCNTYNSPPPKAKRIDQDRSSRSIPISQGSTTAKKSSGSKSSSNKVSPFFRKEYKGHQDRDRTCSPKIQSQKPLSATVKERFQEIQSTKQQSREIGKEALKNSQSKKDLATQVQILENRIKRLIQEEEALKQKIRETEGRTEKVTYIKKRKNDDTLAKSKHKEKQAFLLANKKQEVQQDRENLKKSIQNSTKESWNNRNGKANNVKQKNNELKNIKKQKDQNRSERNQQLINQIKSSEKGWMNNRSIHEQASRTELNKSYVEKINQDKEEADQLHKKLQSLSQIEQNLFHQLSQTQGIHRAKFDELERVFNTPAGIPIQQDETHNISAENKPNSAVVTKKTTTEIKASHPSISNEMLAEKQKPTEEVKEVREAKASESKSINDDLKPFIEKQSHPDEEEVSHNKLMPEKKDTSDIVERKNEKAEIKDTHNADESLQNNERSESNHTPFVKNDASS